MTVFEFQRGEPVVIGQEVVSGDPEGYELRALLKPAPTSTVPDNAVESVAEFGVAFQDATDDATARWFFTIAADDADELPRGRYATDVQFLIGDAPVAVSDPAFIDLIESVSA